MFVPYWFPLLPCPIWMPLDHLFRCCTSLLTTCTLRGRHWAKRSEPYFQVQSMLFLTFFSLTSSFLLIGTITPTPFTLISRDTLAVTDSCYLRHLTLPELAACSNELVRLRESADWKTLNWTYTKAKRHTFRWCECLFRSKREGKPRKRSSQWQW